MLVEWICMVIITFAYVVYMERDNKQDRAAWQKEREQWRLERQQLFDRIQAPSFAEYTNKVIREKKLDKTEEEEKPQFIY